MSRMIFIEEECTGFAEKGSELLPFSVPVVQCSLATTSRPRRDDPRQKTRFDRQSMFRFPHDMHCSPRAEILRS
jgi:hypothetical protein